MTRYRCRRPVIVAGAWRRGRGGPAAVAEGEQDEDRDGAADHDRLNHRLAPSVPEPSECTTAST